jgi:acyl-CoA thioester hydrolase
LTPDWAFVHRERVRFGDLDANRHLNNVVFLRYFETARIMYIRSLLPEHDPTDAEHDRFGVIFAECHINYRAPGSYDDEVDIRIAHDQVKRSSFRVIFEMRVGDRLLAEGYGILVGYDYVNQHAAPLPDDVRSLLESEAADSY